VVVLCRVNAAAADGVPGPDSRAGGAGVAGMEGGGEASEPELSSGRGLRPRLSSLSLSLSERLDSACAARDVAESAYEKKKRASQSRIGSDARRVLGSSNVPTCSAKGVTTAAPPLAPSGSTPPGPVPA
jgi:hypothetical protein